MRWSISLPTESEGDLVPDPTAATPGILAESVYNKAAKEWTHKCGATVMAAKVHHPIWIKGTTGGFGNVYLETVPYCPQCQTKPSESGAPIYE